MLLTRGSDVRESYSEDQTSILSHLVDIRISVKPFAHPIDAFHLNVDSSSVTKLAVVVKVFQTVRMLGFTALCIVDA